MTFRATGQTSGHRTKYSYDNLGQVTSGKRKWQDGSFVPGQQYEYTFDDIGNRTQTKVGGDVNGANLRSASYTPNLLNQYDQRVVPGTVDILGLGVPSTEVRVDNTIASRKGEYFHHPLTVDNSSNPQYKSVSVVSGTESSSGNIFVPKTPEQYDDPATPTVNEGYDEDGNQLRDGRWSYTWDAENRLVKIESLATAPAGSRRRLEFAYDFMGRRIWKKLTNLDTSTVTEERFLYDGWNLVAVLSPSSATILKSFVWGTDLSGSFQGAGGVGGLLKVNQVAAPASASFVAYDGNGNVVGLIDASNGTIAAQYEFGPFGEVVRATGPAAKVNPFRFSTKYQDEETDLLYYGYRYYDASTGRWLSRDPIGERGGINLHSFVGNCAIQMHDALGLYNPIAGPNGPVSSGTGLADASLFCPPLPSVRTPATVNMDSVALGTLQEFWQGLTEVFRNTDYSDCYSMCAWDVTVNALLNPTPWDINVFSALGGYGDGALVGEVGFPGAAEFFGYGLESYYTSQFDAAGGTSRADRLKDLLGRRCRTERTDPSKISKMGDELQQLESMRTSAQVAKAAGNVLAVVDALSGFLECYNKHCAKHCCPE